MYADSRSSGSNDRGSDPVAVHSVLLPLQVLMKLNRPYLVSVPLVFQSFTDPLRSFGFRAWALHL